MKREKKLRTQFQIPRDAFKYIRSQRSGWFGMRVRMTLIVAGELVISVLIAAAVSEFLEHYFHTDSMLFTLLVLVITSAVVGAVLTSFVSRMFYEPFKKLIAAMERIADGDFSVRLEDKATIKEVLEIYTGFNMMAHELQTTETLQSDFVSNVSHEFKTPISAIEGYATLLQGAEENVSQEQNRYIEKILFNTRRLSRLVGNILLLSRVDNQTIQSQPTRFRLDEQIRQSVVLLEPEWEKKDIEFDVELDSIEYTGYENLLMHVWNNLIGNAIKFDPDGGWIGIRLVRQEGGCVFTIEDNGPGIAEAERRQVFNKFYQTDSSHKSEGNGLGLALVKQIVTLCGGTVETENRTQGGCRFRVRLPME